jgi:hypothetical protein
VRGSLPRPSHCPLSGHLTGDEVAVDARTLTLLFMCAHPALDVRVGAVFVETTLSHHCEFGRALVLSPRGRWLPLTQAGFCARVPPPPQPDPHRLSDKDHDDGEDEQEREGGCHPQQCTVEEGMQDNQRE